MQPHKIASVSDIPPGERKIVVVDGKQIGVFRIDDEFYAFRNICPHAFAPVCRGRLEGCVTSDGPHHIEYDKKTTILMCPWHLWEFDIKTGRSLVDPKLRLKRYDVYVKDGEVFVIV